MYSSCCRLSHPHVAQGVYSLSSYVSWMISHMLTVLPCLIFPVYCAGLMIIISLVFISERLSVTAAKLARANLETESSLYLTKFRTGEDKTR